MASNTAIIVQEKGLAQVVDAPIPKLRDDYILVEVRAVALSPADWKHIDFMSDPGCWCGMDYAGIVIEVGSAVTKPFKKGDRIYGACHGGNVYYHEDGAFAKYLTAKGVLQNKIPENLSFEEAASATCGLITISQALYKWLQFPLPPAVVSPAFPLLVYGGATASGIAAIQFAKLSGCRPIIATASPSNFEYLKELGADYIFDYHQLAECVKQIRGVVGDSLTHVLDCIGAGDICVPSMSKSSEGIYCTLTGSVDEQLLLDNPHIKNTPVQGYTAGGEPYMIFGKRVEVNEHDHELAKTFLEIGRAMLAEGKIQPNKISSNEGGMGLEGVMVGLQLMREGKVSARKLVYTLEH